MSFVDLKDASEYFSSIPQIKYEGEKSKNVLAFRYYNPTEIILGKPMKDWLRFSVNKYFKIIAELCSIALLTSFEPIGLLLAYIPWNRTRHVRIWNSEKTLGMP